MVAPEEYEKLQKRIGRVHLSQRLGIEKDHVDKVQRRGKGFFHVEKKFSMRSLIRTGLKVIGLHRRGQRNATRLRLVENELPMTSLPAAFDGYRILHLSDLHLDINTDLTDVLINKLDQLEYDLCVITGDFRAKSLGSHEASMAEMRRVKAHLKQPIYAVLGNHDFIAMVPELEDMGVDILLNESVVLERGGEKIYVAGIDDPQYYKLDNLEKAAHDIPHEGFAILLSHAPRVYPWAAHAAFDFMMCGHTHGGQVCLPGGKTLVKHSGTPRKMGQGNWTYLDLQGYTSVGSGAAVLDVRFNCPPEITVHTLRVASATTA